MTDQQHFVPARRDLSIIIDKLFVAETVMDYIAPHDMPAGWLTEDWLEKHYTGLCEAVEYAAINYIKEHWGTK